MSNFSVRHLVLALIASCCSLPVLAQDYPVKPVRMIVPWPAGGLVDIAARAVAKELQASMGQPFVVDNRVGAGGVIGADLAAKAPPDGYTLTLTTSAINMNAALGQKLPFDVGNDFAPVAAVAYAPSVVVVNVGLAAKTVQELTALARARPGKLSYASAGIGSPAHLATELYKSTMGLDIAHIPYKGAPQAITDLIAGHVDILFANAAVALPQIRAGAVRAIAVTGAQRFSALPELPTMAESGVKDFEADQWLGILAPRATPPAVLRRLRTEIDRALVSESMRTALTASGMSVAPVATLEQFSGYLKADLTKWTDVVKRAQIKAD
ncbi:MAG: tripartite tricarboxylate transporter substrate binding protein [Burkholderiaceae bacterium]|jgi:tripartite-type tricarboxylate transporter receptor subunit TctC